VGELKNNYHGLEPGDTFIGRLSSEYMETVILVDMLTRDIHCLPSPLAQILSGSKVNQTIILQNWMLPLTTVILRRRDFIDTISTYTGHGVKKVVTKEDKMHCGHGIRKWDSIDLCYNCLAFSKKSYPFVLQPFLDEFLDVRVVIAGDYMESYEKVHPNNFRKNLSTGGSSRPFHLSTEQENVCRSVMSRGKFPFAHIDIQITENGNGYLSEISLNGGLKGAKIDRDTLDLKKNRILEHLAKRGRDSE
jgi:ribosomal protein S6--L-glutamate ligase